jgi:hypothetical protein
VNLEVDAVAVSRHRFVDGVVQNLVHEVVEPEDVGVRDIHRGPGADGLTPLQNLDG